MICAAPASTRPRSSCLALTADGRVCRIGIGPQDVGAFAGEQLGRAVAVDDGQHRTFAAPAARRVRARGPGERGDLDPARGAERQGRLDGAAGVVGVHVHRIATAPSDADAAMATESPSSSSR